MAILTTAELTLGLSRHLAVLAMGPEKAALGNLEYAGWVLEVAFRLRGSTTSPIARVKAIGLDVGLSGRNLDLVIRSLEAMGWATVTRDAEGKAVALTEVMPTPAELVEAVPRLLKMVMIEPVEEAALVFLRATTLQPLLTDDALHQAVTSSPRVDDQAADAALRHLTATGLIRRVRNDDGREVIYNPNIWTQGDGIATAALRAADAQATTQVTALLEELAEQPGLPQAHVTSTEQKWVLFAISQGLVQRSLIQTSEGVEQGFLFTPHLTRGPFGRTAGDASGHVRQLVGSMIYATTFASYKLRSADAFLRRLIADGVAGNASPIGTDYPMLEKAGIVRVVPGSNAGLYQLELLQAEVAEDALQLIEASDSGSGGDGAAAALRAQRSYVHVERDRARLAQTTDVDEVEQARLIAALRDVSISRRSGPR